MKKLIIGLFFSFFLYSCGKAQNSPFEQLLTDFEQEFSKLRLPWLSLSYETNFKNLPNEEILEKHQAVLQKYL